MDISKIDYVKHNSEVTDILRAKAAGKNDRILMAVGTNPRMILSDPARNTGRIGFGKYFDDPDTMAEVQLRYDYYRDTELFYDHLMGPSETAYYLYPDFQNLLEPSWLGCPSFIPDFGDPASRHFLTDDKKRDYIKGDLRDPLGGYVGRAVEYLEYFRKLTQSGFERNGRPVSCAKTTGLFTDGPFTNACSLRGATDMCVDLYEDPDYAAQLLDYITESTVLRIKTLRKMFGLPERTDCFWMADDSIAMLSCADYERFVLPFHKKLMAELTNGRGGNYFHLCGDATRHFPIIARELGVTTFDSGFPVRHGELLKTLPDSVSLLGGVHVDILRGGSESQVRSETKRILDDVRPYGSRFTIKEANNLTPGTPSENVLAMYETVKEYGVFRRAQ